VALPLPPLPMVELEIVREERDDRGFLHLRRLSLVAVRGSDRSETFSYDVVERRALDACVIVAHHDDGGRRHVWLRSCVRPPVALRPDPPPAPSGVLWELPAGLVEPGESPRAAAQRELAEELGFFVDEDALRPLGDWTLPAPGFIGEMHVFFEVRVDPGARRPPAGDGSPLEAAATVVPVPLDDALDACRRGLIRDAKTELALRRLAEAHP
jgi:ADP-ribose pyrophosphatase